MSTENQLRICRICINRKLNINRGLICGFTYKEPDFSETCPFFHLDSVSIRKSLYNLNANNNETTPTLILASQGKRFANLILDTLFNTIINIIFILIIAIIIGIANLDFGEENIDSSLPMLLFYLILIVLDFSYYLLTEGVNGRSPAKYLTGTKVVDEYGEKPKLSTIFIRTLCRFIPFEAFSFFGWELPGWHDRFSKTRVIEI